MAPTHTPTYPPPTPTQTLTHTDTHPTYLYLLMQAGLHFLVLPVVLQPGGQLNAQDLPPAVHLHLPQRRRGAHAQQRHLLVGRVDHRHQQSVQRQERRHRGQFTFVYLPDKMEFRHHVFKQLSQAFFFFFLFSLFLLCARAHTHTHTHTQTVSLFCFAIYLFFNGAEHQVPFLALLSILYLCSCCLH